jgi:enterobactin synthetase component D
MPNTPANPEAVFDGPVFPEPHHLHQRLRLPREFGFSALSVHDHVPPALTLPASLGRAVPKRQREYLAGRRCANEALLCAGYPESFYPAMGEDRLPIWPSGWIGSISHSGDHAVAIAAAAQHCSALGIDIQEQASEKTMNAIGSLIAKPEELTPINGLDMHAKLLLIFSAKESLYKALYPQVRKIQEFDAAKLIQSDAETLVFELTRDWSALWKANARIKVNYTIAGGYMMTVTRFGVDSAGMPMVNN